MRLGVQMFHFWCHVRIQKVSDFRATQILDFQIRVAQIVLNFPCPQRKDELLYGIWKCKAAIPCPSIKHDLDSNCKRGKQVRGLGVIEQPPDLKHMFLSHISNLTAGCTQPTQTKLKHFKQWLPLARSFSKCAWKTSTAESFPYQFTFGAPCLQRKIIPSDS